MSKYNNNFFYPLIFPFYQEKWFSKTWWLNLISLIPIIDLIIFSGWRYNLIKNMANNEDNILPNANILSFFKHGIILWFVGILFIIIPTIIIFTVGSGLGGSINEFLSWFLGIITKNKNTIPTEEMILNQTQSFVIRMTIESIWIVVSIPIMSTGLARYAITGKIRTLFNIPVNVKYATKYIGSHFIMWVFKFFLVIFVGIIVSLLVASIILSIFAPMFGFCVYYWSTGFEVGHLAEKIKKDMDNKCVNNKFITDGDKSEMAFT